MIASRAAFAVVALALAAFPADAADWVSRESEIAGLRLGQKVYVDDGSCAAGQIKMITGVKLLTDGVQASRGCVDRKTARR